MKLLKITIFAVVASLFTFPAAAASNIQQEIDFEIVLPFLVLELYGLTTSTIWNVDDADEFQAFYAEQLRWDVDFFNAELTSSDCELTISVFDDDDDLLSSNTYDCLIDSSGYPARIKITPTDHSSANNFVTGLSSSHPDAVKVVMSLEIDVEQIDVEQQSTAVVDFRWYDAKIADTKAVLPRQF